MTLGRSTFIDEIIRKAKYQSSIGHQIISTRIPTITLQAVRSPSIANAEIHSRTKGLEQSF